MARGGHGSLAMETHDYGHGGWSSTATGCIEFVFIYFYFLFLVFSHI
jgi:uncharacterized membrane protein YtjA (UPF0391 family)